VGHGQGGHLPTWERDPPPGPWGGGVVPLAVGTTEAILAGRRVTIGVSLADRPYAAGGAVR
jgi:hypothetical protein